MHPRVERGRGTDGMVASSGLLELHAVAERVVGVEPADPRDRPGLAAWPSPAVMRPRGDGHDLERDYWW